MEENEKNTSSERGQSMVELAFSMVIVLILLAGVVDLGRAFFSYMALRDAAQEGAFYGSVCPDNPTEIENRVRSSSSNPVDLTDTSTVSVACTYLISGSETACSTSPSISAGNGIKLVVSYNDFHISMPFLGSLIGTQTITLRAKVTDTILRKECQP